jgi:hypothetical protein
MIKTNSNYCFSLAFSAQETFAQSKKKGKQIKKVPPKWKLKVLTPKRTKAV